MGLQYDGNVIGRLRKKRAMQTIFLDFNGGQAPSKPRDMALRNLAVRFIMQDDLALIKKVSIRNGNEEFALHLTLLLKDV